MNKRALTFGVIYCIVVIIFKLVILLGGYTLSKFGFYYSNIVSMLLILPFFYLTVKQVRDKDYNGIIGGKECVRLCLTVLATGVIIISLYNYIEFNWKFREIAEGYYNSQDYLDVLTEQQKRYPDRIKRESFPAIIQEQIRELSAFKATTGKLIPMLFIGLAGSFMTAILMKRSAR
jgi:hypothetical protein